MLSALRNRMSRSTTKRFAMSALQVGIAGGWILVARARRKYIGPSEYVHGPKALAEMEAFLFDLDGTLIDSNAAHADTWAQAFREHGIACDAADVRPLLGSDSAGGSSRGSGGGSSVGVVGAGGVFGIGGGLLGSGGVGGTSISTRTVASPPYCT